MNEAPTIFYQEPLASIGHGAIGLICSLMPGFEGSLVAVGFIVYEMGRVKSMGERVQSYEEFALGFLMGRILNES
jgi:hypothetical protein